MRIILLSFLLIFTLSAPATAQEDSGSSFMPLFLKPVVDTIKNTFTSRTPTVVQREQEQVQQQGISQSTRDRLSGPGLVDNKNPWAGTSFGRLTREIDYFDAETRQYHNQYDYMALLSRRGDQARLSEVSQYLQQNGVFDPRKYQAALQGQSPAAQQARQRQANPTGGQQPAATQRRVQVAPQNEQVFAPKRLHQGYDEDMEADTQAQPRQTGAPIFLR